MTSAEATATIFTALADVPRALADLTGRIARLEAEVASLRAVLPPQLVTLRQAADALGVSYATIRRRTRDGSVPVRRVGRSLRVDLAALHTPAEDEVLRLVTVARVGR